MHAMTPPPSVQRASSSRKAWLVLAALLVSLPLVGVLLWGMFVGWQVELEPGDRKLVLNTDDLATIDPQIVTGSDSIVRTKYLDGTWAIESEYETELLYVYSSVTHERTERDARNVYLGVRSAGPLMAGLEEGVTLADRDDLFHWGDDHTVKEFRYQGEPAGVAVYARNGTTVITVSIGGWIFENSDQLHGLLDPWLQRIPK